MAIKIFTDAGSNLFPAIQKRKNTQIIVLPMILEIGDTIYSCYEDKIDVTSFAHEFYEMMREGKTTRTSLVNPQTIKIAFEKELKEGNDIICYTMAKGISGTYQAAILAKNELEEKYKERKIYVVDTKTASLGEGLQAIKGYQMAEEGKSFEDIVKESEKFVSVVRSEFTADNIKYIARTGRVSSFVAKLAGLLNIKVMLKGSDDSVIVSTGKVQGRKMSIKSLAKTCIKNIVKPNDQIVYIAHCDDIEAANKLKGYLDDAGIQNVEIYDYDLITGAHIGPGGLAIFYIGKNRD